MNWRLKLAIKVTSGRIPVIKSALQRAGFFRHGKMESRGYAMEVFNRHLSRRDLDLDGSGSAGTRSGLDKAAIPLQVSGGVCLEIGPGESLVTMILAKAAGFDSTLLIDHGSQIGADIRPYVETAEYLRESGYEIPEVTTRDRIEDVMEKFNARYLTEGVDSMKRLEPASVDFSFSQAVFEHIPKSQVSEYLRQLRRVGKRSGFSSHRIDLKDHLGGSVNHLRFSEANWETERVYKSGVYTNRLRFSRWQRMFEEEGIAFRIVKRDKFESPPIVREKLSEEFRALDDEDLATNGFDVLFRWNV